MSLYFEHGMLSVLFAVGDEASPDVFPAKAGSVSSPLTLGRTLIVHVMHDDLL